MGLMSGSPELRPARLLRPGLVDYMQAWEMQRRLAAEVRAGGPEALVLCSHPPTATLGRRATADQLRVPRAALEARGVRVVETDRGGGATVHGPGQLVGYPILRLGASPDLHRLLRSLEAALIRALRDLSVEASRREGLTGVWVGEEKIVSIGMRFQGGVTLHGFALNVHNDLDLFDAVVPCGLAGVRLTSVARIVEGPPEMARVEESVTRALAQEFALEFDAVDGAPAPAEDLAADALGGRAGSGVRTAGETSAGRGKGAGASGLRPGAYELQ
jgi:lipoate-protein ligase B